MGAGGGAAVLPGQRGDVDDPAEAAFGEVRAEHLGGDEGAAQVDRHRLVELFRGDLHQRRDLRHPGVVHQDVAAAPALREQVAGVQEVGLLAHVQFDGDGRFSGGIEQVGVVLHGVEPHIGQRHAVAGSVQAAGDAFAQAARCAGDQCDSGHLALLTAGSRARRARRWS
ncbi:hypothetical protein D3C76_1346440 [compost metagenome]